jgi:glycosyltransferase involved in cell wall biosynthesis
MERRLKLLFLCHTLPYPPDGGIWIRTYHVLRLLSQVFDVTALCFERAASSGADSSGQSDAAREALGRVVSSVEVFRIPQRHNRVRFVYDHLRSTVLGRVYTTYVYESRAFERRLHQLLDSTKFDLVHVDSLDLARYLPAVSNLPVACVHIDFESSLLRRRAEVEQNALRRAYFLYQSGRMEEVERRWCRRVALNVAVSERDRDRILQLAPESRVVVVPNGVDTEEFHPDATDGTGVAYVGGTNPFPNLDALEFFSADVLPHLRDPRGTPIKWIGRASPEQQRAYAEKYGIELTGYVEDVRPLLRDAACHIVPLRVGGGTRLKILNSWAMGKPVVSTSVGCEGLDAIDGENILIRDEPAAFAEAIARVLDDAALRRRLGEGGRATAERLYGWNVVGERMNDAYLALANGQSRTVVAAPLGERARYAHS